MIWILLIAAFILLSSNKSITAPPSSSISPTVTNPTIYKTAEILSSGVKSERIVDKTSTPITPVTIIRTPPPGYSGPVNGPFTWSGVGEPPNGDYTVIGNAAYLQ